MKSRKKFLLVVWSIILLTSFTSADVKKELVEIGCTLLQLLLYISSAVAALFLIKGGFTYLTSESTPERHEARNKIIYALVGLAFIVIACPLVDLLVEETKVASLPKGCCSIPGVISPPTTTTTIVDCGDFAGDCKGCITHGCWWCPVSIQGCYEKYNDCYDACSIMGGECTVMLSKCEDISTTTTTTILGCEQYNDKCEKCIEDDCIFCPQYVVTPGEEIKSQCIDEAHFLIHRCLVGYYEKGETCCAKFTKCKECTDHGCEWCAHDSFWSAGNFLDTSGQQCYKHCSTFSRKCFDGQCIEPGEHCCEKYNDNCEECVSHDNCRYCNSTIEKYHGICWYSECDPARSDQCPSGSSTCLQDKDNCP